MNKKNENVKPAVEIGMMAGQLSMKNQSYVLNTINALLFSQQVNDSEQPEAKKREGWLEGNEAGEHGKPSG